MSDREQFIGWIADRFQQRHVPPLPRDKALEFAAATMAFTEADVPFGAPDHSWNEDDATAIADEEIETCWETASD